MTRDCDPMDLAMLAEINPVAEHPDRPMRPDDEQIPGRDDMNEDDSHE